MSGWTSRHHSVYQAVRGSESLNDSLEPFMASQTASSAVQHLVCSYCRCLGSAGQTDSGAHSHSDDVNANFNWNAPGHLSFVVVFVILGHRLSVL